MAGSTPNLGLYLPGGGSTGVWTPNEVADIDTINQNFVTLDTWAGKIGNETNRQINYVGTAAAMGGALVPSPKDGDTYQETDGNKILWKRVGGVWITNEGGLFKIRPASVAGAGVTVDSAGNIVCTNVASGVNIDILGIFSSRFRNYKILSRMVKPGASGLITKGLVGAAPYSGATHFISYDGYRDGTNQQGNVTAQTDFGNMFGGFGGYVATAMDLFSPNLAEPTEILTQCNMQNGYLGVENSFRGDDSNTQHTGLRIIAPVGGTTSGVIQVYGYA